MLTEHSPHRISSFFPQMQPNYVQYLDLVYQCEYFDGGIAAMKVRD
jgi:hypothetical protein